LYDPGYWFLDADLAYPGKNFPPGSLNPAKKYALKELRLRPFIENRGFAAA
jgi:hypothetical protein